MEIEIERLMWARWFDATISMCDLDDEIQDLALFCKFREI